ncbi:MAG TPA: heterodisulfide reductase-related iron-sulfur binding cluster [Opitutaceae bacterium]|nr:heterodisulfide reductase-related iron-sulfur binding cluster [Opitutaceae bacterium]
MLHTIKPEEHGPLGGAMAHAVQTCVHCGFCLAACPTYREFGQEMDSPRGRIVLMKQVLEGELPARAAQVHVDRCLGCLACEPACPSGVPYRDLISPFRAEMEARGKFSRDAGARLRRWLAAKTIPFPRRMRVGLAGARVGKVFRALVPRALQPMLDLAPTAVPPAVKLPRVTPAHGERRARVALLAGCAQQVLDPDINLATIEVLARNGVEVLVPPAQGCCGGLAWHTGDLAAAREFARRNLDAFPADIDAIVTNAAGCGSAMHEYHLILRGTADEARAENFRRRVVDVSVFLARLGLRETPRGGGAQRVAYHDACHLANAQGVRDEPRRLLRAIPALELREVAEAHLCCGSAGTYNLDQPGTAASLGAQKARAVSAALVTSSGPAGASVVASGNIGCLTQLRLHLAKQGSPIRVRHTMQVLRDAYRG